MLVFKRATGFDPIPPTYIIIYISTASVINCMYMCIYILWCVDICIYIHIFCIYIYYVYYVCIYNIELHHCTHLYLPKTPFERLPGLDGTPCARLLPPRCPAWPQHCACEAVGLSSQAHSRASEVSIVKQRGWSTWGVSHGRNTSE